MHYRNSSKGEYRADIDGIRALAVLSVFFFHLQPDMLPGGFLGVDVFFVISGYLITGILLRENHLGKFSFSDFYARRVKRIFPALFIVLLISAVVATFSLPPETYVNFMASARYASGQLANIFFSRDVGYFDEDFSTQPLLHTWSLGVEEQFYLFWPLLIYFCFWLFRKSKTSLVKWTDQKPQSKSPAGRSLSEGTNLEKTIRQSINKKIAGVMVLLSLVSFTICFVLADGNYNLAFYMFYTRALEFCVGGLISLRILPELVTKGSNNLIGALGLLLLFYSFLFIKDEYLGISFLQFGVLLPCVGTALIIQTDSRQGLTNKILAMKMPVYVGRISYSLYLYHWPVIIFWKIYSNTEEISFVASLGIISVSFILSTLSYLFVEQPARKSASPDRRILALAGAVVIVFAVSFGNLENYETASWRITRYVKENSVPPKHFSPGCHREKKDGIEHYKCNEASDSEIPVVALVGDSHSPHFLYSTTAWAEKNGYDVEFHGLPACPILVGDIRIKSYFGEEHEEQCRQQISRFQTQTLNDPRVDIVLIAHRFDLFHTGIAYANRKKRLVTFLDNDGKPVSDHTSYYSDQLAGTVETIRKKGKELIILKQVPIFIGAKDCDWEPLINKLFNKKRACEFDNDFITRWQQPSIDFIDQFAATYEVAVMDPVPFFRKPLHDGRNLYKDSDHLNEYGKQFLVTPFGKAMDEIMVSQKVNRSRHLTQYYQGSMAFPPIGIDK